MAKITITKTIDELVKMIISCDLKDIKDDYNSYVSAVNSGVDYINNGFPEDMKIAASMGDPEKAAIHIKNAEEKLKTAKDNIAKCEPALPILITAVRMKTQALTQS